MDPKLKIYIWFLVVCFAFAACSNLFEGCQNIRHKDYNGDYQNLCLMDFKPVATKLVDKDIRSNFAGDANRTESYYVLDYKDTRTGIYTWNRRFDSEWEAEKYLKSCLVVERRDWFSVILGGGYLLILGGIYTSKPEKIRKIPK